MIHKTALQESDGHPLCTVPCASYNSSFQKLLQNAQHIVPIPQKALSLISTMPGPSFFSEFDKKCLGGGLKRGLLYELVGPAGIGKTQWCYTAAANLIGRGKFVVIWIDTESSFNATRLLEVIRNLFPYLTPATAEAALQRLIVVSLADVSSITEYITNCTKNIGSHNISLIVVDSVASAVRLQYNAEGKKSKDLHGPLDDFAKAIKRLLKAAPCPAIVTNQTQSAGQNRTEDYVGLPTTTLSGAAFAPALGSAWFEAVNLRIMLGWDCHDVARPYRISSVTKSSYTKTNEEIAFEVVTGGVEAIANDS